MENAISSGILRGRPFGGVSVAWSPDLNHAIKPLTNYKHSRVVSIELQSDPVPIIFISIYMPFLNTSKRQESIVETIDCISMLHSILHDHPNHHFVIGGYFNTELKNKSPFDTIWNDFISEHDLQICDHLVDSSVNYTYVHGSLNQRKWNDHFVISKALVTSSRQHKILEERENPSDHLPILMQMQLAVSPAPPCPPPTAKSHQLKWDNCSETDTRNYTNRLHYLVQANQSRLSNCLKCHCDSDVCRGSIQAEYDSLIDLMKNAGSELPRFKAGMAKPWWTPELTSLKQKNISITEIWKSEASVLCTEKQSSHHASPKIRTNGIVVRVIVISG